MTDDLAYLAAVWGGVIVAEWIACIVADFSRRWWDVNYHKGD